MNTLFFNLKNITRHSLLVMLLLLGSYAIALAQIAPASSCDYTLELLDSGNSGWDGAYITVSVDGAIPVNYTIASGGSNSINLAVNNGSIIDLYYNAAAFENEHEFRLLDAAGNVVYSDGPYPTNGPVPTIKAACPLTCDYSEPYVILINTGDNPEEISWELSNGAGTRVAYANAGNYTGVAPGTQIQIPVNLSTCENYTFAAYDGAGNGWEGGFFQILTENPDRGNAVVSPTGFYEILTGNGTTASFDDYKFTLPCIECPSDLVEIANGNCELTGYVYPAANIPVPVTCYPNVVGGGAAPVITVSYPTATPAALGVAPSTSVTLPVGVNPAIFQVTYADGQILRCSSEISVISTTNPTMSCNDNINISLNDLDGVDDDGSGKLNDDLGECYLFISPDMVLEAPGICEGEYIVTVYDADGNTTAGIVTPSMIGQTLDYKVEHIASTNHCWGTITIEDKLAPHIECIDYTIACNHPDALDESFMHIETLTPLAGQLPANIMGGAGVPAPPSVTVLDFEIGCGPLGEVVQDVDVYIDIDHTDISDLEIVLVDPSGTQTVLMTSGSCTVGDDDLTLTFDDDAVDAIADVCNTATGAIGTIKPLNALNVFNNLPLANFAGSWELQIIDNNNTTYPDNDPGIGEVVDARLIIKAGFPSPHNAYDCDDVQVDLINEMVAENNCSEPWIGSQIMRTWRATDPSGNISTCTQTINLQTPSFNDLIIPSDKNLPCGSSVDPIDTGVPTFDCFDLKDDHIGLCDLSYTYTEVEIPSCGQGRKIIREWTVVNWCASVNKKYTQIIQVQDNEGPIINAQNIQASASTYTCDADIQLSAYVTDACSQVTQVTASYVLEGGAYYGASGSLVSVDITSSGTLNDLPEGVTEVMILAKDACGNSTQDTIEITVIDDVPPAAICDDDLHITLNGDGTARLFAQDVDEGSFDNCGVALLEVRRVDGCLGTTAWDEYVDFDCCDVGVPVRVELRVTDYNGNESMCWLEAQLEDQLPPILSCPTDKTINCDQTYVALSQFGDANAVDNCGVDVELDEVEDIDNCGAGVITRTWTATDAHGNSNACQQLITFNHVSDFAVQFPADVEITSCTDNIGDTGEPTITDDDCELIAISHEDQIFDIVPDACFKIIRTWTVINWCTYDINATNTNTGITMPIPRTFRDDGDGYMEFTQVIKVTDNEEPVIELDPIQDRVVDVVNGCTATFVAPKTTAFDDCNGEFEIDPVPSTVTGAPGDVATITYTAEDGCGNVAYATMEVTFADTKKPTPVCINGLSIELMQTGSVQLWATDFQVQGSSYDNCTAYEDLVFSFSSDTSNTNITYDCGDVGTQVVELWVTDEAGNQDFCSTYIIVQDNMDACNTTAGTIALGGYIENEMGDMVEQVTVNLSGNNAIPTITNNTGNYAFPNLAMFGNYTVEPEKDMNPLNGVTTFDLVIINKHVLGIEALNSPYKMIAADVNNDGNITTFDVVQLRQLILYIITELPSNDSWRFVDASYVFPNPNNPFSVAFPEAIDYNNMATNQMAADFIGIKIGDVNNSATPNSLMGQADDRNAASLMMSIDETELTKGQTYTVDFRAKDFADILGYQYTLKFDADAIAFMGVEAGALDMTEANLGLAMLDEGVITTSWNSLEKVSVDDDAILFSLEFYADADTNLSEVLSTNSRYTAAEAYNDDLDIMNVELTFNAIQSATPIADTSFELYQNRPNPFNDNTVISFNLPEASAATLSIYDVSGKLLKAYNGQYARGYNEVTVNKDDLSATGVLYYQLATENQTATKKMIIVE